jgi:hypothetical protein
MVSLRGGAGEDGAKKPGKPQQHPSPAHQTSQPLGSRPPNQSNAPASTFQLVPHHDQDRGYVQSVPAAGYLYNKPVFVVPIWRGQHFTRFISSLSVVELSNFQLLFSSRSPPTPQHSTESNVRRHFCRYIGNERFKIMFDMVDERVLEAWKVLNGAADPQLPAPPGVQSVMLYHLLEICELITRPSLEQLGFEGYNDFVRKSITMPYSEDDFPLASGVQTATAGPSGWASGVHPPSGQDGGILSRSAAAHQQGAATNKQSQDTQNTQDSGMQPHHPYPTPGVQSERAHHAGAQSQTGGTPQQGPAPRMQSQSTAIHNRLQQHGRVTSVRELFARMGMQSPHSGIPPNNTATNSQPRLADSFRQARQAVREQIWRQRPQAATLGQHESNRRISSAPDLGQQYRLPSGQQPVGQPTSQPCVPSGQQSRVPSGQLPRIPSEQQPVGQPTSQLRVPSGQLSRVPSEKILRSTPAQQPSERSGYLPLPFPSLTCIDRIVSLTLANIGPQILQRRWQRDWRDCSQDHTRQAVRHVPRRCSRRAGQRWDRGHHEVLPRHRHRCGGARLVRRLRDRPGPHHGRDDPRWLRQRLARTQVSADTLSTSQDYVLTEKLRDHRQAEGLHQEPQARAAHQQRAL